MDKNSGFAGKPRNIGLKHATADYIMFLDPDDIYLENACKKLYEKIVHNNIDLVSGNFCINNKENIISWNHIFCEKYLKVDNIKDKPSLLILPPSIWTKIYKKDFLLNNHITFDENLPGQDALFMYNILIKAKGILFFNEITNIYLKRNYEEIHQKSVTDDVTFKRLREFLNIYNKMYDCLNNFDSNYVIALSSHLNYWSSLYINSNLNYNEKIILTNEFFSLFKKINENKSNNDELIKLLHYTQTDTLLKMLKINNNDLKSSMIEPQPPFNCYDKITKLNNKLYLKEKKYSLLNLKEYNPEVKQYSAQLISKSIKVSVIIVIKFFEESLQRCLNSLINQTLTNIEIICIYNSLTEDNLNILEYFKNKDSRIKIIKVEEEEINYLKNIGINYANGEYIQFLDSNYWLDDNALKELYDNAKKHDSDIIISKIICYDYKKDNFYEDEYYSMSKLSVKYDKILKLEDLNEILFDIPPISSNKFFKSSFIKKNQIYFNENLKLEEDLFFFENVLKTERIVFINKYYYNIMNSNNLILNSQNVIESAESIYNFFKTKKEFETIKEYVLKYILRKIFEENDLKMNNSKKEYEDIKQKINEIELNDLLKNNLIEYIEEKSK